MYTTTANAYQQGSVSTASPAQLVLMLYDRVLAAIVRVQAVKDPRSSEGVAVVNTELQKAQDILNELRCTLDHERGGDIAKSLDRLYDFCLDRLIQANVAKDRELLAPVFDVVKDLRDSWEASCCRVAVTTG